MTSKKGVGSKLCVDLHDFNLLVFSFQVSFLFVDVECVASKRPKCWCRGHCYICALFCPRRQFRKSFWFFIVHPNPDAEVTNISQIGAFCSFTVSGVFPVACYLKLFKYLLFCVYWLLLVGCGIFLLVARLLHTDCHDGKE